MNNEINTVMDGSPKAMVKRMKALAKKGHKGGTRKCTGAPYITHPEKVVDMLESWGYSADDPQDAVTLAIGWGHDLLEETDVSVAEIAEAAGGCAKAVCDGIRRLTFVEGQGISKEDYITNIARTADPSVLVVKIADRICNTLDFCESGNGWARLYLEYGEALYDRLCDCKGSERIRVTLRDAYVKSVVRYPRFPDDGKLTADMLKDFQTTPRGSTRPRVGTIEGERFIAKCGSWSDYSSDGHVHNEYVADNLLRAAGLNVPFSREYRVDFGDGKGEQTIRLAVYGDELKPLGEVWGNADASLRAKIRAQVVAAYPVQALIAGIDTFTYDNVKVGPDGKVWFVDNGASFNYRARGKKKGWFWERVDVDDPTTGYLSLAKNADQCVLQEILGTIDDDELWAAASAYSLRKLVRQLPDSHRRHALKEYAKRLDDVVKMRGGKFSQ